MVIFNRLRRRCRLKSMEHQEIIICVDEKGIRNYYRELRSSTTTHVENRQIERVFPDVKRKYFVQTQDGYLRLIGELVQS